MTGSKPLYFNGCWNIRKANWILESAASLYLQPNLRISATPEVRETRGTQRETKRLTGKSSQSRTIIDIKKAAFNYNNHYEY